MQTTTTIVLYHMLQQVGEPQGYFNNYFSIVLHKYEYAIDSKNSMYTILDVVVQSTFN